jgi:hypothetical protein
MVLESQYLYLARHIFQDHSVATSRWTSGRRPLGLSISRIVIIVREGLFIVTSFGMPNTTTNKAMNSSMNQGAAQKQLI